MAKKITGYIKLQVPAGTANPSPPIGRKGSVRLVDHGCHEAPQFVSGKCGGAILARRHTSFPRPAIAGGKLGALDRPDSVCVHLFLVAATAARVACSER